MTTKVTNYVNVWDLEKFIKEKYGHDVEIVAMEEASNDTSLTFEITGGPVDEYDFQKLADWVMTGVYMPFGTQLILEQMHADGYVTMGNYVIEVSW